MSALDHARLGDIPLYDKKSVLSKNNLMRLLIIRITVNFLLGTNRYKFLYKKTFFKRLSLEFHL